ncbi:MAG: DNA-binding response regulator [Desulfobacca sp.]|nr:DNA-binding response regulator [Desulfobacca sp.]
MTDKKKILIVDDHPLFRAGLKSILITNPSFEIIEEAGSGNEALQIAKNFKPHLVILDISLPDKSGIEVARELKGLSSEIMILMVSMHSKIDYITEAFQAGALGYVVKDSASERLIEALETIFRGDYYLDSSLSGKVVERLIGLPIKEAKIMDQKYTSLSSREEQILRLLAEGQPIKEIAEKLFISPKTVENHRANIMEKLDLHSTLDLIRYAVKIGLIDPDLWKS